jgi:galactokinase
MSAQDQFKQHFGHAPTHIVRAPGRLELLGGLAEHNEGLALSVAVDKYVSIAAAPRRDGRIELVSPTAEPERFWINDSKHEPATRWSECVRAVLDCLGRRGASLRGFDAAISNDFNMGADLGSTGAIATATLLTLRRLQPFSLTSTGLAPPPVPDARGELPRLSATEKWQCARLLHAGQNGIAFEPGTMLDTISSLFGKAGHVMCIDFRFLTVEYAPLIGEAVVVCDAGLGANPNPDEPRLHCESAARQLGAKSLRSVELKFLEANKSKLTAAEHAWARYVVGETALAVAAERALHAEDHRQFGHYLFRSDDGAREIPGTSVAEADLIIELAQAHPACLGSRRMRAGFGGATLSLVAHHQADLFRQHIARQYEERTGARLRVMICQIADGAI